MEEERRLKKEFKIAADAESDEDGGFILKKAKEEESEEEAESIPEDIENLKPEKVLKVAQKKAKKELKMETDTDLLKRFYGDETKLDSTDKFLRNYILLQCWKDNGTKTSKVQEQIDREDEERDAEMEDYEQKYNFRFEEPYPPPFSSPLPSFFPFLSFLFFLLLFFSLLCFFSKTFCWFSS